MLHSLKAITLRNVPPQVARLILETAKRQHSSLNMAVISLIEKLLPRREAADHHDLDHLIGSWSAKEAAAFDREIELQRRIEPDLWA